MTSPEIVAIVTCKGRLAHLKRTLPRLARSPAARIVIVDAGCPDGTGQWVERSFPDLLADGRLVVERLDDELTQPFNKARAANRGADRAAQMGAQRLWFVDADTFLCPESGALGERWERLEDGLAAVSSRRFAVVDPLGPGGRRSGLTGIVAVSALDFGSVGGFDEGFECWGCEDIDLRLRLALVGGCRWHALHASCFREIPHGNVLRTRHYPEKNLWRGARKNRERIERWVQRHTGASIDRLPPELGSLVFLPKGRPS